MGLVIAGVVGTLWLRPLMSLGYSAINLLIMPLQHSCANPFLPFCRHFPEHHAFSTGITTTGTPHLGNFVGHPSALGGASLRPGVQSFYFLADYHALIKCEDPVRIQRSTLEIAASWLAAGLIPRKVTFYRQSDIPEIPELCLAADLRDRQGPAQPRPCLQGQRGQEPRGGARATTA